MSDSPGREEPGPAQLCRWCSKALTEEEARGRVCQNCVRLLSGAGLSDTEIYGQTDEEDEQA